MKTYNKLLFACAMLLVANNINAQCIANAGNDTTICGNMVDIHGTWSHNAGAELLWTSTNPDIVFSDPTSENTTATLSHWNQLQDTVVIIFTETIPPSICVSSDTVIVVFCVQPVVSAGFDFTACGQTATLSADAMWPGYWTSNIPNVIYSPAYTDYNAQVMIPSFTQPTYNVTFTWHATNGACISSDNVVVVFLHLPHVEAGPTQSVCGYTTTLHADTTGAGIIWAQWSSTIAGITINQSGNIPANSTVDASTVGNLYTNSQAPVYFYWVAHNNQGCTNVDSVLITFYEIPDANAGIDDYVCGKTYDLIGQYSLDNPTGNWTIYTMPFPFSTADFLSANTPDGEVTVSDNGVYQFIWTERNAGNTTCFDRDTITLNFMTVPHPDAGFDQSLCGKYALLHADTTPGTTGYWPSILNAWYDATPWPGDTISCLPCSSLPDVVAYFSSENVTVTFYWMETSAYGCFGYDSVNVYFGSIQPAVSLTDPADSVVCGNIFTGLNAQNPTYGFGYWYDNDTATTFYAGADPAIPDSVVIGTNSWGYHNFYWATSNGDCGDTSAAVTVLFNGLGGVAGTVFGLGGNTDYTAGLFESGSPIIRASGTPDASGNYFINGNGGQYYLKVDNDNPSTNTGIATTYYGDTWQWSEAILLDVPACDTINANVTMYTFPYATGGSCRAYGTVMFDNGSPVENANVYLLYKPVNTPAILEQTNASGYFSLNNISQGNYKIKVDITGLPQVTTHHITVNPFDTLFPDVNFIVDTTVISKDYGWGIYADSNLVYGIGNPLSAIRPVNVFPVPFSNELFIESFNTSPMIIEWYSQDGKMISSSEINISEGRNRLNIPTGIGYGVYYLKVGSGNTVYIKKLVRE